MLGGNSQKAGRLVDDQDIFVLIQYLKPVDGNCRDRLHPNFDDIPTANLTACDSAGLTVDRHPALTQHLPEGAIGGTGHKVLKSFQ